MKRVFLFVAALMVMFSMSEAQTAVCVVHRGEWVWIRDTPSKEGVKIGSVRYGYEMDVSEIVNMYAHVNSNGTEGWVDVSYLEIPQKETVYRIETGGGPLIKRETPDGRVMGYIRNGVTVSVLGWRYSRDGVLWAKVYKGGYVCFKYLKAMGGEK